MNYNEYLTWIENAKERTFDLWFFSSKKNIVITQFFHKYLPDIKKIFGVYPCIVVELKSGVKAVVKPQGNDKFDYEKGVLWAYVKATKLKHKKFLHSQPLKNKLGVNLNKSEKLNKEAQKLTSLKIKASFVPHKFLIGFHGIEKKRLAAQKAWIIAKKLKADYESKKARAYKITFKEGDCFKYISPDNQTKFNSIYSINVIEDRRKEHIFYAWLTENKINGSSFGCVGIIEDRNNITKEEFDEMTNGLSKYFVKTTVKSIKPPITYKVYDKFSLKNSTHVYFIKVTCNYKAKTQMSACLARCDDSDLYFGDVTQIKNKFKISGKEFKQMTGKKAFKDFFKLKV